MTFLVVQSFVHRGVLNLFTPVAVVGVEAECERRDGVRVPAEDVRRDAGLLRQDQRRKRQEQLRPHLRVARRTPRLRISSGWRFFHLPSFLLCWTF